MSKKQKNYNKQVYGTFGVQPSDPSFRQPLPPAKISEVRVGPRPRQPLYFWKACANSRLYFRKVRARFGALGANTIFLREKKSLICPWPPKLVKPNRKW